MIRVLCFIFLLPFFASSQPPGNKSTPAGQISGVIIDSITRSPLEYVAVGILDAGSFQVVNGGITNEDGVFSIADLKEGSYILQASFVGYASLSWENIIISQNQPVVELGTIIMSPESQLLEEVRIVGEAALIEARPDKIIYNAERDVTSAGGDASDVLRKVPLLTVDFDGNVSMRGSENIKILINGRPSGMFSDNVADALKMMPADQIKSVEVITSPGAKYDGEGTAGIINIITRKKNVEGVAGSVDLTTGTRSHRGNGNFNYGKGRLGINISGGGHYSPPLNGSTIFRREETGTVLSLLEQEGISRSSRLGYRTTAGLEYNFNTANSLNTSISFRGFETTNENNVFSRYESASTLVDSYNRQVNGVSARGGLDWELDFTHILQEGREWSVAFEIENDFNKADFDYVQEYTFPESQQTTSENNLNKGKNFEITAQTDYVHAFTKRTTLETGIKGNLSQLKSDFDFSSFDPDLMVWNAVPSRSDIFYYDQYVYAGYGSLTHAIGEKYNIIAGARYELTTIEGSFEVFNSPFRNKYSNLLPSITLSSKMGELNLVKVSYNQRIERPRHRHVNPFIEYNDNRDISYGNPYLFPELVHQVEIGTNIFIKGNMINVSLFGRRTEDLIESLLTIDDEGISESTYYNFGKRSAVGVNVFGSLNLGDVSIRGGFDVNAWEANGDFENEYLSNSGFDANGRMNITWTISETFKAEAFSFYRSPTYTVQGRIPNWSMMSFGLKKELFKKRLTVGINITEPFRENMVMVRELEGESFKQYSRTLRPVRSFGINLGYRFGKIDFNERSGKKKVNNNEEDDRSNENQF